MSIRNHSLRLTCTRRNTHVFARKRRHLQLGIASLMEWLTSSVTLGREWGWWARGGWWSWGWVVCSLCTIEEEFCEKRISMKKKCRYCIFHKIHLQNEHNLHTTKFVFSSEHFWTKHKFQQTCVYLRNAFQCISE